MKHMTGFLQAMAINCSEETGKEGETGAGVAFCVKRWIDHTDLSLKDSVWQDESLLEKIRVQVNKENLVVGIYYRPPDQEEDVDEEFLLQLQEAPCSQTDPARGFQSPWHLLEKQESKL